jgi:hypothetical protein
MLTSFAMHFVSAGRIVVVGKATETGYLTAGACIAEVGEENLFCSAAACTAAVADG